MTLDKANANLKLDARMLEYNLRVGNITKEEYQKHLASLPDVATQCEKIEIEDANGEASTDDQH